MYGLRYSQIRIKDQQFNLNLVKIQRKFNYFTRGYFNWTELPFSRVLFSYHPSHFWFCCSKPILLDHQIQEHNSWLPQDKFCASCAMIEALLNTSFIEYIWRLGKMLNYEIPAKLAIGQVPSSGLEPETSPLPRECSTAELQGQFWSGPGWIWTNVGRASGFTVRPL